MKISRKICCLALSLSLSALLLGFTSASAEERMYVITEAELTLLERNLSELSSLNEEQQERLTNLQERLESSEEKLKMSEEKSVSLSTRLTKLSAELTEQANSLENANLLLSRYEKEKQRTMSRLKRQRNIGYALAVIAVIFCVVNK